MADSRGDRNIKHIYQSIFHLNELLYEAGMDTLAGNIASSLAEELKWNKWIAEPIKDGPDA